LAAEAGNSNDVVLDTALVHIDVYVAADKYGVAALQQQAADALGALLFRAWAAVDPDNRSYSDGRDRGGPSIDTTTGSSSSTSPPGPPSQQQPPPLTPASPTAIIDEVYNGAAAALPDRGMPLRELVFHVMHHEITTLLRESAFDALLARGGAVAVDALHGAAPSIVAGAQTREKQQRQQCPKCRMTFMLIEGENRWLKCWNCEHAMWAVDWAVATAKLDLAAAWRESELRKKKKKNSRASG
jgi:ribosomal protein S27AE